MFDRRKGDRRGAFVGGRQVPVIPPLPPDMPGPIDPNPVVAICGECGLQIHQTMGYVCGNARCPTGLGGPSCKT